MMLCLVVKAQIYQVGELVTPTENNPDGNVYKVTKNDQNDLQCVMSECKSTGDIVVPASIKDSKNGTGYTLKIIETGGNVYGEGIRSITFSEGIKNVTVHTLTNCSAKAIYLPSTITQFNDYYWTNKVGKVIISPNNPKFYGDGTYVAEKKDNGAHWLHWFNSQTLENVTWDATTGFSHNTDWEYTQRETLDIPEGITYIKQSSLAGGGWVTTINFPASLTYWHPGCFGGYAYSWHDLNIADGNPYWKSRDGILYTAPTGTDSWTDTDGKTYGTTLVRVPAYRYHKEVVEKGEYTATFPEGVKTIMEKACSSTEMTSVQLPNSVETIEKNAFFSCTKLRTVSLGSGVTSVTSTSFAYCTSLTDILVDQNNTKYSNGTYDEAGVGDGILYSKDKTHLMTCPCNYSKGESYTIPDVTTHIDEKAFYDVVKLKTITLGANVEEIGTSAFSYSRITSMYVGPKVKTIGVDAFNHCTNLKTVTIGNKVETIDTRAFDQCNITTFNWEPTSICKTIGGRALKGVDTEEFTFPASVETVGSNVLSSAVKKVAFENGSNLKTVESSFANSNVEEVNLGTGHTNTFSLSNTFYGCKNLTTVFIPAECVDISDQCFMNCSSLTDVTFGENSQLKTIGTGAFAFSGLKEITLPDHLENIKDGAFKECTKLTDVHVPSTTTSIHPLSFLDCSSLTNINVERANETYATSDGMLCSKDKQKLVIYPAGKITDSFNLLSPSITTIGEYSFYDAKKLKSIVIPKKVNKIENYAFYLCDNLKMITFLGDVRPASVETDVAADNAKTDDNQRDHRFGNMTNRGAEYIKKFVTINIRKNQNTQDSFKASDSYWYGAEPRTSFEATYANSTRTDGKNEFEYMFMSDQNELGVVQCNSTDYTAVMPATAKWTDENEYPVKLIADYAFEAIPSTVKEMVFLGPIEYVGANAFNDGHLGTYKATPTSNIENIFFTDYNADVENTFATVRFGLNSNAKGTELYGDWGTDNYPEFTASQHIYMPKSKEKKFREEMAVNFADQMTYKIPGISISTNFGSFSREFDVDLSDANDGVSSNWDADKNKPKVIAYTTKVKNYDKDNNVIAILVKSINCKTTSDAHDGDGTNTDGDGDGTYIPANTGVLIQAIDGSTPTDFYYRIGERKGTFTSPTDNIMMPVVENSLTISPTDNYIVSGGTYKYLTKDKLIPVHKSYLHVAGIESGNTTSDGAKTLRLIFNEEETNGIREILTNANTDAVVIYNLQGQRVNGSAKGIVIKNGKKMYIK